MKNRLLLLSLLIWLGLLSLPFTARAAAPSVATLAASGVTATSATLHGTVDPNGAVTTAYYEYGLTTNYGSNGAFTPLPATDATLTMTGLVVSSIACPARAAWTQTSPNGLQWVSIAASADGTRLTGLKPCPS